MRSKPATQQTTARPRTTGARSTCSRCAIHAPIGATAKARPRKKCVAAVNRFVREYKKVAANAAGESANVRRLIAAAAATNPTELVTSKMAAGDLETSK